MLIGLEAGMRKSEILRIRVEHRDLAHRKIFVHKAKAGAREQPITANLALVACGQAKRCCKSGMAISIRNFKNWSCH